LLLLLISALNTELSLSFYVFYLGALYFNKIETFEIV